MVLRALILASLALAGSGTASGAAPGPSEPTIEWRSSRSLGVYWDGRLVRGVRLPAEGPAYFTWDPVKKRAPNREWRRVGTDRLLRLVLRVLDEYAAANPGAPRVGIGDLSRPGGGDFGPRFGGHGHVSHQIGLDVDVYYPRLDRRELQPRRVAHVDRELAQDLVDRFVDAGARRVFVGPSLGLKGPRPVVQALPNHDDHLHVRLPLEPVRRWENPVSGHELELPRSWRARARADGATVVTTRHVRLRLVDQGATRRRDAKRAGAPLELARGPALAFRSGGHVFEAVVRGGRDSARLREQSVALLESVRLTAFGRAAANRRSSRLLGHSHKGRPIRVFRIGNPRAPARVLVVGCIHGNECSGMAVTQRLLGLDRPLALDLWVVPNLNPDGLARDSRRNARGVDLNRDFLAATQRETRIARALIRRLEPDVTLWFHQPQAVVRAWGPSRAIALRYAELSGADYRSLVWPPGTAPRWQNAIGQLSFVVELPAGELSDAAARRHVDAVLRLVS